jgi:hypothetical protein
MGRVLRVSFERYFRLEGSKENRKQKNENGETLAGSFLHWTTGFHHLHIMRMAQGGGGL